MEFPEWLRQEMETRGWNQSEMARRMGVDPGTVGNVLNGNRQAGPDFCITVARALGISREEVFRARGWLLRQPEQVIPPTASPEMTALINALLNIPPAQQPQIIMAFSAMLGLFQGNIYEKALELRAMGSQMVEDGLAQIANKGPDENRSEEELLAAAIRGLKDMMMLNNTTQKEKFLHQFAEKDPQAFAFLERSAEFSKIEITISDSALIKRVADSLKETDS